MKEAHPVDLSLIMQKKVIQVPIGTETHFFSE